jgi:hydrophobic/amphiphilic exporter-1 (mainly G- bacteria), HAE1 family
MSVAEYSLIAKITEISLRRPVTVLVLFVSILVVGFIAAKNIPLELFPRDFVGHHLGVSVRWQNASAQDVLEKITRPLEAELSTVKGLKSITSDSDLGQSNLTLSYRRGTDMKIAYREARDRVQRVRLAFPKGVEDVRVHKFSTSDIPVINVVATKKHPIDNYYDIIEKNIVLPLSRLDGVAQVIKDFREKELLIDIDKEKANALGVTLNQLVGELQSINFDISSGHIKESGDKYTLRSLVTYKTPEHFADHFIRPGIRVRDIGVVRYEPPKRDRLVLLKGEPVFSIKLIQESDANTVELGRRINEMIEAMRSDPKLEGVGLYLFDDSGEIIEHSIANLLESGYLGGLLATLVLFLFLKRFRLTVIIALSIPLSLIIALIVMYFAGESLNILSILGLIIGVGLLIDNSVVVAENILRLHEEGATRSDACIQGVSEVALAVTMATFTTILVFLPASLIEGDSRYFLLKFALPITIALIASLAIAFIFIPLAVYFRLSRKKSWLKGGGEDSIGAIGGKFNSFYSRFFSRFTLFYHQILAFFINRKLDLTVLMIGVFILTAALALPKVKFVPQQDEARSGFGIFIQMSSEYSVPAITEYLRKAESIVAEKQQSLGLKNFQVAQYPAGGGIWAWMDRDIDNRPSTKQSAQALVEALPKPAGVKIAFGNKSDDPNTSPHVDEVYRVRLFGSDAPFLRTVANQLESKLVAVSGVLGAQFNEQPSPNQITLVIDREKTSASNVDSDVIAGTVANALQGRELTRFNFQGRSVPVRMQYELADRSYLHQLNNFSVPTPGGGSLPISALSDINSTKAPDRISRRDQKVSYEIVLDLESTNAGKTRKELDAVLATYDFPEGISLDSSIEQNNNEEQSNLLFAAVLSVLFIYLLMGLLFESFILPLSIVVAIPLALVGMIWAHYVAGANIDQLGGVGAILLIGVVVNNGIVLIDCVNRLRGSGLDRVDAVLQAAQRRFRPVVMTSMTTIIGMIPLMLSEPNEIGFSYKSFGLTLIGGMTTATLLTLIVVPICYIVFDDLRVATGFSQTAGTSQ